MLELVQISCGYGAKEVISSMNFSLEKGEIVSLLGANGSGKSTLLKAIVGLLPYTGRLLVGESEGRLLTPVQRAQRIAYVPQSTTIPFDFNVLEVVLMGRFHASSFGLGYTKHDTAIAFEAMEKVGITSFASRIYRELSGGERQLVLIARAFAQQSALIVMDEPVTGLDLGNQMRLLELMRHLSALGHTLLQTTHYPDHALRVSHKVAWIEQGRLLAFGTPETVVTPWNIRKVYGVEAELFPHTSGTTYMLPIGFSLKEQK